MAVGRVVTCRASVDGCSDVSEEKRFSSSELVEVSILVSVVIEDVVVTSRADFVA